MRMLRGLTLLATLACAATASASPPPGDLAPVHGHYAPRIDAGNFVRRVRNPYLPFAPGTRIHFTGTRGRTAQTDDEVVLHGTKRILGIACTIVRDTVSEHGAEYGLCRVYGNEPWHFELRPEAAARGCPPTYADPTHDPRMQR